MEPTGLKRTVAPTSEPLTVAELKLHCRVEADLEDDDDYIASLGRAARGLCERTIDAAFITQTWRLSLDRWPCGELRLPRAPLQSVTSVTYYDADGVQRTVASTDYDVDTEASPGRLVLADGSYWPETDGRPGGVRVTYVAGYGLAAAVPDEAKLAIRLLVGMWYENREEAGEVALKALPTGVEALLRSIWNGTY